MRESMEKEGGKRPPASSVATVRWDRWARSGPRRSLGPVLFPSPPPLLRESAAVHSSDPYACATPPKSVSIHMTPACVHPTRYCTSVRTTVVSLPACVGLLQVYRDSAPRSSGPVRGLGPRSNRAGWLCNHMLQNLVFSALGTRDCFRLVVISLATSLRLLALSAVISC